MTGKQTANSKYLHNLNVAFRLVISKRCKQKTDASYSLQAIISFADLILLHQVTSLGAYLLYRVSYDTINQNRNLMSVPKPRMIEFNIE